MATAAAIGNFLVALPGQPLNDDASQMLYYGWLMHAHAMLPYRDFVEVNMPGAFLAFRWSGQLFGFDVAGGRLADAAWLALSVTGIVLIVRPAGRRPALFAASALALVHLDPALHLQRESVALPGVLLGAAALLSSMPRPWSAGLAGLGAGYAVAIRPQFVMGLLAFAVWLAWQDRDRAPWRGLLCLAAGASIPLAASAAYLLATGTAGNFGDTVMMDWPAYAASSRGPLDRTWQQMASLPASWTFRSGHALWLLGAAAGLLPSARLPGARAPRATLLALLTAAFLAYPSLGHAYPNHWLPFLSVSIPLAALALVPSGAARSTPAAVAVLLVALVQTTPRALDALPGHRPGDRATSAVAEWLRTRAAAGQAVQPLDWVGGTFALMLESHIPLATRHPEPALAFAFPSPARDRAWNAFVTEFHAVRPALLLCPRWMHEEFATTQTGWIPEVAQLLDGYQVAYATDAHVVYERRP
jgi:hypothetical protein